MREKIEAIVENGLLRPLAPLHFAERELVSVTVESSEEDLEVDTDILQWASEQGDASISLDEVRGRLASLKTSLAEATIAERGDY